MTDPVSSKGRAPALNKGLDIIEFMASQREPSSLYDIANGLGRTRGEVYRMLNCLVDRGYLEKIGDSELLVLSDKLFSIAQSHASHSDVFNTAREQADKFCQDTGCSFSVSVRSGCYSVSAYNAIAQSRLTTIMPIGVRTVLWKNAPGQALLSGAANDELGAIQVAASEIEDVDLESIISKANFRDGVCLLRYDKAHLGIEVATCVGREHDNSNVAISCFLPGEQAKMAEDITRELMLSRLQRESTSARDTIGLRGSSV